MIWTGILGHCFSDFYKFLNFLSVYYETELGNERFNSQEQELILQIRLLLGKYKTLKRCL